MAAEAFHLTTRSAFLTTLCLQLTCLATTPNLPIVGQALAGERQTVA